MYLHFNLFTTACCQTFIYRQVRVYWTYAQHGGKKTKKQNEQSLSIFTFRFFAQRHYCQSAWRWPPFLWWASAKATASWEATTSWAGRRYLPPVRSSWGPLLIWRTRYNNNNCSSNKSSQLNFHLLSAVLILVLCFGGGVLGWEII